MELTEHLEQLSKTWGADFFGVADLSSINQNDLIPGNHYLSIYPRAVALGIALIHDLVDPLSERLQKREVMLNYRYHAYDVVNTRLDILASQTAGFLQREGYHSLPIPVAERVNIERFWPAFSHKFTAHQAGLGWIGKNCLLITPQAGPRVRWITVLTTAPLQAGREIMKNGCGTCQACTDACPVHAISGRKFSEIEPRELRVDVAACDRYIHDIEKEYGQAVCGMCLDACPYGKKASKQLN